MRIAGRDYTVEPELAAAYEAREREFQQRLSEQGREFGEMRTWRRQMEERLPPPAQTPGYDYNVKFFEEPEQAMERFYQERIVPRYTAAEQEKRHWDGFYKAHQDLADEDWLVKGVANELLQTWTGANDPRAFLEEVAKESRSRILRLSRKGREANAPGERLTNGRAPVEGGGGRRTTPEPEAEPAGPQSMSDVILEIQRKRRSGRVSE